MLDEWGYGEGASVKHLNPRQGITTYARWTDGLNDWCECETPKSPPGDYNPRLYDRIAPIIESSV